MKQLAITLGLIFLLGSNINAQKEFNPKGVIGLEERKLIVMLRDEDPDYVKKIKKKDPAEYEDYVQSIADFNKNIKTAVEQVWDIHDDIAYKHNYEMGDIMDTKDSREAHAFLVHVTINSKLYNSRSGTAMSNMDLVNCDGVERPIATTLMPFVDPTLAELIFGLQRIQNQVKQFQKWKGKYPESITPEYLTNYKALRLKEMTLLLDENELKEGLADTIIEEEYPWEIEITDSETIQKKIENAEEGYAYVFFMPMNESSTSMKGDAKEFYMQYQHIIVTCKDGELLLMCEPGISPLSLSKTRALTLEHFEYFASKVDPRLKKDKGK